MNPKTKKINKNKRHRRIRAKIFGTAKRPRVSVFKSNRHVFIQVIDDETGKTIVSSNINPKEKSVFKGKKTEVASVIGGKIAEKMNDLGIKEAVFDRGGFKYHGRIKAVAEGLKNGGIKI